MKSITIQLKVWRQKGPDSPGKFADYTLSDLNPHMSFLEMLDLLNEDLIKRGEEPVEFDSDCREGICGSCGFVINGVAHGPWRGAAACQVHMREYNDGDKIIIEPFRAKSFPIIKDLVIDRSAFDRIMKAGGYVSINAGSAPEANNILIAPDKVEQSMDFAQCIGCGACVAACPNSSSSLFVAAKIAHLSLLPQGAPERKRRVLNMVEEMEKEGFGDCSNYAECEAVCPKEISIDAIAVMRREYLRTMV